MLAYFFFSALLFFIQHRVIRRLKKKISVLKNKARRQDFALDCAREAQIAPGPKSRVRGQGSVHDDIFMEKTGRDGLGLGVQGVYGFRVRGQGSVHDDIFREITGQDGLGLGVQGVYGFRVRGQGSVHDDILREITGRDGLGLGVQGVYGFKGLWVRVQGFQGLWVFAGFLGVYGLGLPYFLFSTSIFYSALFSLAS